MSNHYVKGVCLVTAKLGRKSRITVPKAVRTHLGLRVGEVLHFAIEGDRVVLTKAEWDGEDDRSAYAGL